MDQLTYLEGIITVLPGLQHPELHVMVIKKQSTHTLLFTKIEKNEGVSGMQLFRLRYEYQQSIHDGIDLPILFGSGLRVQSSASDTKIRSEFEKLGYTVEFSTG